MKPYDIFISYRRDGGEDFARAVYQDLHHRKYRVFLDRQNLESGNYEAQVLQVISQARDVILILPPHALDRCIEQENDLFRREIVCALQQHKNLIPIVRRGFSFPEPEELPEEIQELLRQEAIMETPDSYDAVLNRLCDMLKRSADTVRRQKLRRISGVLLKILAVLVAAAALTTGGILLYKHSSSGSNASSQTEKRSNNNHGTTIVETDAYASRHIADSGKIQELFLGQTYAEAMELLGADITKENADQYAEKVVEVQIPLIGDVTSFPLDEPCILGDCSELFGEDSGTLQYSAMLILTFQKNKLIFLNYTVATADVQAAETLRDELANHYADSQKTVDEDDFIRVENAETVNGNLSLYAGESSKGTFYFQYMIDNGMDLPEYMSDAADATEEPTTEPPEMPEVTAEIDPETIYSDYSYNGVVQETFQLTKADVTVSESYGNFYVNCVLYGTKTDDCDGSSHASSVSAEVQLVDADGNVVDSTSLYSPSIRTGETFKESISFSSLSGGTSYTIRVVEDT